MAKTQKNDTDLPVKKYLQCVNTFDLMLPSVTWGGAQRIRKMSKITTYLVGKDGFRTSLNRQFPNLTAAKAHYGSRPFKILPNQRSKKS